MATAADNQRLEFLGDRVLGLVIAEALLAQDPAATEGDLAPRLNALVRKETCAEVAAALDLGPALRLGPLGDADRRAAQGGAARRRDGGGDRGGLPRRRARGGAAAGAARLGRADRARCGASGATPRPRCRSGRRRAACAPPVYVDLDREGPDHAPVFSVEARLADGRAAEARAASKRAAQQVAAEALLALVEAS